MSNDTRYQWLLNHIRTCRTCAWRNEDDSSKLCGEAELYFRVLEAQGPTAAAHEVRAAGGIELPGFSDVAVKPSERRYPS
jgi:hypothetical protein